VFELLEILKGAGSGGVVLAVVIYILDNRGYIKSKRPESTLNGELKELTKNISGLTNCVKEHVIESNLSHQALKEAMISLSQTSKNTKQEIHEINLKVHRG
jgi:hypothetical protein